MTTAHVRTARAAALTTDEILRLPAAVDLVTAGRALGIGRTKAHELARAGEWPTPLLRLGTRYRVRRADLLDLLGIDDPPRNGSGPAPPDAGRAITDNPIIPITGRHP